MLGNSTKFCRISDRSCLVHARAPSSSNRRLRHVCGAVNSADARGGSKLFVCNSTGLATPASSTTSPLEAEISESVTSRAVTLPPARCRFGFPKGSLQGSTQELFQRAGFKVKISERGYFPEIDDEDLQLVLFRSQEIPRYVEDGVLDAGICGYDWIVETNADVVQVCELHYSKATSNPARWVLAVPQDSCVRGPEDLEGTIVASELVDTTKKYFEDRGINVKKVEYSWGATEVKASLPGVGGIVDITETGSSLKANKLRIVDTILSSTTRLIANRSSWEDPIKRSKIEDVAMLLKSALEGRKKVGLKMNLKRGMVAEVAAILPSEQSPTVSALEEEGYVAVEVIVDEKTARSLVPYCKRLGATGIFTYSLQTIVH